MESISSLAVTENDKITIPLGNFESPQQQTSVSPEVPERLRNTENDGLLNKVSGLLIDEGHVKDVKVWRGSWGFKYEDKILYVTDPRIPMPKENYDYYIFRLGWLDNKSPLWPKYGRETDTYRFRHEMGHAYQEYLIGEQNPGRWYEKAINGEINSPYSKLFKYCYDIRSQHSDEKRGLTTWGNQPEYNDIGNTASKNAVRAIEDSNDLVNMYLWHPKYFDTYLMYISRQIPNYDNTSIVEDGLVPITIEESIALKQLVLDYVDEMKLLSSNY